MSTSPIIVASTSEIALPYEQRTIPALLKQQSGRYTDKKLITSGDFSNSYAQVLENTARLGAMFVHYGVKKGDRIVVMSANRPEVLELFLACAWTGAIFTPVNTAARGEQLRHVIATADPEVIVIEQELLHHLQTYSIETPSLSHLWIMDLKDDKPLWNNVEVSNLPAPMEAIPAVDILPSDPLTIIYTSGTTGPSKGVLCSHSQFCWWGHYGVHYMGITEDDVLFTVLPFFHTNAISALCQTLMAGASYTFEKRFSASKFWRQVTNYKATVTYLLGTMSHILLDRDESEYKAEHQVRIALSAATSAPVVEAFRERFGTHLIDGYGSTETNHIMSTNIGSFEPGTMGRLVDDFEVMVVDDNDIPVTDDEAGEMLVRNRIPDTVALGYFGNPEATIESRKNLWFHTGDRVIRRSDGVFLFVDRKKDAIRRRGENISSHEVESAIIGHPSVNAVAVVGTASEIGEEEVMAFIVLGKDKAMDPIEIMRYLEPHLAYYAIPRYIEFLDELPVTENGKVRKTVLRDFGVRASTWDREAAGIRLKR
ncbi:MAG: AMP-binding protein [Gammaproteobacteria bacterium]|nr:AMP-binding protein [Gammaproteobacteria bacterium]